MKKISRGEKLNKAENQNTRAKLPETDILEQVWKKERYKRDYRNALRNTTYTLITVIALALLVATLVLPVIHIYGTAMEPTIKNGSIIVCSKTRLPKNGEVTAFYYNNKILIRRVIACPGDVVNIDENDNVTLNGKSLDEKYINTDGPLDSDLNFPYTVPEGKYFVLADNRGSVMDSSNQTFGDISEEDIIGKVILTVWPLKNIGMVH